MLRTLSLILALSLPITVFAQTKPSKKPLKHLPAHEAEAPVYNPLELLGIRPGIGIDSIRRIMTDAGVTMREVQQDTLTHCFADQSVHIYIVDSIICRLTYMRMSFLLDDKNRLRRFTITPRESSIAVGASDDIEDVLLLYFGQIWGKPELTLEPPLPNFRWRTGNIEVRGFIKRGYPLWVMEG
ncbi:MAG TPA: hypothetical protein VG537_02105 [Candidatus Kapabacteria bacterium]|jgi:hypothetical protein|nr:hypothetical protein [Candidatus Kapabacteria bacterium]